MDEEELAKSILIKIREKFEQIGDPPYKINDIITNNNNNNDDLNLICICCLLEIKKGDLYLSMPCCGSWAHVSCIGAVANAHRSLMNLACPQCLK